MTRSRNKQKSARQQPPAAASVNTRIEKHSKHQPAHGNAKKTHPQHRSSLLDRMTRGDQVKSQPQQGGEAQAAQEQASATKRKRGEDDIGGQQEKRTRLDANTKFVPGSQSAQSQTASHADGSEAAVQPAATDLKVLQSISDAQKMARRRDRFASAPAGHHKLGVSKVTKITAGRSTESSRQPLDECKAAGVEKALAPNNNVANTSSSSTGDHRDTGEIVCLASCKENNHANVSTSTKVANLPVDQAIGARTNSVTQHSLASTTNSERIGNVVAHETLSQGIPSSDKKGTATGQDIGSTAGLDTDVQRIQAASTKSNDLGHAINKLEAPRVVINDERLPMVESNPENVLHYIPYDFTSVLLLASYQILHDEIAEESVSRYWKSNPILNRQAMDMYERPWASQDLGRGTTDKTIPARIINDCDLYFRDNKKIYVATEMGLILAADYCKAIGVPNQQPVRFEGRKPRWAKKLASGRNMRRVDEYHPRSKLPLADCLSIPLGVTVEVYERCQGEDLEGVHWDFAYGRRTDDGAWGFFDYRSTCRMDWGLDPEYGVFPNDPKVIDWSKFDYRPGVKAALKYKADLAAGKYGPEWQRKNWVVPQEWIDTNGYTIKVDKSRIPAVVGNMALTGVRTPVATPASSAITTSVITKPVAASIVASAPAQEIATTVFATPVVAMAPITKTHSTEMLSVAGGLTETNTEEPESSRYDSHEPNNDTEKEDDKDDSKADMTEHNATPEAAAAQPVTTLPTSAVGTIRRRVGRGEYVEDEVDYDDDEL